MNRSYYSGSSARRTSVEELRRVAMKRVPRFVFEYVEGGAETKSRCGAIVTYSNASVAAAHLVGLTMRHDGRVVR